MFILGRFCASLMLICSHSYNLVKMFIYLRNRFTLMKFGLKCGSHSVLWIDSEVEDKKFTSKHNISNYSWEHDPMLLLLISLTTKIIIFTNNT